MTIKDFLQDKILPGFRKSDISATVSQSGGDILVHFLLDRILGVLPDASVCLDLSGRIILANSGSRSLLGDSLIGVSLSGMIRTPSFLSAFDRLVSGLSVSECVSWEYGVPADRYFDLYLSSFGYGDEFSDRFSEFPRFLVLFRETTSSFRIEHMRSDFVANASHELRTPLTGIIGSIEVLQGPGGDDISNRREFLSLMSDQAKHMAALIDDLLSLNHLESGSYISSHSRIDILSTIRRSSEIVDGLGGSVELCFPDSVFYVLGDGDELIRCFRNLIENGILHGGGSVVVSGVPILGDGGKASNIRIDISDKGPGIPSEHIPRLTERFYRVPGVSATGSGLGLSIVKHILSRHEGFLSISSRLGEGSVFSVTLPVIA